MRIPSPFCLIDRHRPHPDRIRSDWLECFSTCKHCGKGIRLRSDRTWVKVKPRRLEQTSA